MSSSAIRRRLISTSQRPQKNWAYKTVFYVAPQLWAWAPWRIGKLRKCCDKLICILPFEENWFKSRGVDATYVGHPLLDELIPDASQYKKDYSAFEPKNAKLLLLPGSRTAEIDTLWKPMQQIALRLKRKYPQLEVTAVALDEKTKQLLRNRHTVGFGCSYITGSVSRCRTARRFRDCRQRHRNVAGRRRRLPDGRNVSIQQTYVALA